MAKRLEHGLELLRERLVGRGAALSTAALAAWIGENASAAVTPAVIAPLSQAAALYAAGHATSGLVSAQVTALANAAGRAFALSSWYRATAVGFGLVLLAPGPRGWAIVGSNPKWQPRPPKK